MASHSILVATTGELAPPSGLWVAEGIRWRVVRHGSAGKQEQGCPSTSVSKTWTFFQGQEQTTVVWKWSLTVCLSFTAHSWPWTPRWSAHGAPRGSVQNGMEPFQTKPVAPKSAPTQNQRANTEGPLACETGGIPIIRFRRWCIASACCAAQALALSLLER